MLLWILHLYVITCFCQLFCIWDYCEKHGHANARFLRTTCLKSPGLYFPNSRKGGRCVLGTLTLLRCSVWLYGHPPSHPLTEVFCVHCPFLHQLYPLLKKPSLSLKKHSCLQWFDLDNTGIYQGFNYAGECFVETSETKTWVCLFHILGPRFIDNLPRDLLLFFSFYQAHVWCFSTLGTELISIPFLKFGDSPSNLPLWVVYIHSVLGWG